MRGLLPRFAATHGNCGLGEVYGFGLHCFTQQMGLRLPHAGKAREETGTVRIGMAQGEANDVLREVLPQIYPELHRMASSIMHRERSNHTLQPTALISEMYLLLVGQRSLDFRNRAQVLGIASQMMRRILVNHHHARKANKRGGEVTIVCMDAVAEPAAMMEMPFGLVDEVLGRLAELDERQAKIAELRIFGGMTIEETAQFLGISAATVSRDWFTGKLWLTRELRSLGEGPQLTA